MLTEDAVRRIVQRIEEEEREWSSVAPELYRDLRGKALEALSSLTSSAEKEMNNVCGKIKGRVKLFSVERNRDHNDLEVIAADASSYPMPITLSRMALISGLAVRASPKGLKFSVKSDVINEPASMGLTPFRYILSARRESLIPSSILHQIRSNGPAEFVVIDGPLSVSEWYKEAYGQAKVKEAVDELIRWKGDLMDLCEAEGMYLIAVVKRGRSTYFHNYFDLMDDYTDQFVFHNVLDYGHRTESVSINEAIRRWKTKEAEKRGKEKLLIARLPHEIKGFYIKTSDNPLVPPIRVEYPGYLREEDKIASYVLSTAVLSNNAEYDGLPKAQCLAHTEANVSRRIMGEIFKEQLARIGKSHDRVKLLALIKGYRID